MLEITIRASGHARRRLRRYGEFADVKGGTPGILVIRQLTSFNELPDFEVIQIGAAAARADVYDIEWKLLSVGEALTSAP